MTRPSRLRIAEPNCVADDFGGEIVALNLDTGYYFSLRGLASGIWLDLAAGHSTATVTAAMGILGPAVEGQANALIDDLLARGLMVVDETEGIVDPVDALRVSGMIDGGEAILAFEVYDDMQDLVLNDPIHDVDLEAGWPVRRVEG